MKTLVLFGDSILDNAPYTRPEPDTAAHLKRMLPGWSIVLGAEDGGKMGDIPDQLAGVKDPPTVAVLSVGGNDAVEHIGLLRQGASSAAHVMDELLAIADDFAARYEKAARAVVEKSQRTVLCTIYEVQLEPPEFAELAKEVASKGVEIGRRR